MDKLTDVMAELLIDQEERICELDSNLKKKEGKANDTKN